jgi:hypothetical protein
MKKAFFNLGFRRACVGKSLALVNSHHTLRNSFLAIEMRLPKGRQYKPGAKITSKEIFWYKEGLYPP